MYDDPYDVFVTDNETPILKATRLGLNRVLMVLLGTGEYDLDAKSWTGDTAMSVAVATHNYQAVHQLFCHGASVQCKTRNGDSLLHLAVENDDEVMLALLIKCGLDPSTSDERLYANAIQAAARKNAVRCGSILVCEKIELRGVLEVAARAGASDFVRLIVEMGSQELTSKDLEINATVLGEAIESGSAPLVSYLLRQGASVEGHREMRLSPIHLAAKHGNLDFVKCLVEHGADPFALYENPINEHEAHSAMCECIRKNHTEIIRYLLPLINDTVSSKAVLSMATAAVYAVPPNIQVLRSMLSRIPENADYFSRRSKDILLGAAAAIGNTFAMSAILKHNIPTETADEHGWTALHIAAKKRQVRALHLLLGYGAAVNARTNCGVTPLHFAAYEGDVEAISLLLAFGANIGATALDGSTPMIAAAFNSHVRALSTLMSFENPVDKQNHDGETALHYVIMRDNIELFRSLTRYKVDLEVQCRRAGTALHLAASKGFMTLARLLILRGSDVNQQFRYRGGYFKPPKEHGPDSEIPWNQVGLRSKAPSENWITIEDGWTPLHAAACSGHLDVVLLLIGFGAEISVNSAKGETPLHIAASSCLADVVEGLLISGADLQATTSSGDTPLHLAASALMANHNVYLRDRAKCGCTLRREAKQRLEHPDHSKSDCIEMLLEFGANVQALNNNGLTPFLVAVQAGNKEAFDSLLGCGNGVVEEVSERAYVALLKQCGPDTNAKLLKKVCSVANRSLESDLAWNELFLKACSAGNHKLMALAIEQGVSWCEQSDGDLNPLLEAISKGHAAAVKMMLKLGANPRKKDDAGLEALHLTCCTAANQVGKTLFINHQDKSSYEMAQQLLVHGAQINATTPNSDTALHLTVATGNSELTALLLRSGASVDIRNNDGQTPLHAATRNWVFPEIIEQLLRKGACPSAQDHQGYSPLHYIRDKRKEGQRAVELLMEHGCRASIRARNGDMAHHRAGKRGEWDIVKQLMQTENLVHTKGFKGRALLHIAARRGDRSIAESFVQRGANWNVLDDFGKSPRDYLKAKDSLDEMKAL